MATYYYLLSSLPSLKSDADAPISYKEFLDLCKGAVSQNTYNFLENLTVLSCEGPLVKEWSKFYSKVNDEMIYQRNLALGKDAAVPVDRDSETISIVQSALHAKNPLEAEEMLLSLEFKHLDSILGLHYFDDYVLNGYALKLKLLERKQCFKFEEGKDEFKNLFENIKEQILKV